MELARLASKQLAPRAPEQQGSRNRKKDYHAIWDGFPQLSYRLRFDRPDPHGQENAKCEDFRPFWLRIAAGTQRNPGRGLKMEKRNFSALGVPKRRKKLTTLSGMVVRNFLRFTFCPTAPPRAGNRKIRVFRPFWPRTALDTWRNPGAGPKMEKCNFPVLGALL